MKTTDIAHNESLLATLSDKTGKMASRWVQLFNNGQRPELAQQLIDATSYIEGEVTWARRFYHLKHGPSIPMCYCGNEAKFVRRDYNAYCSQKCATSCPDRVAKIKATKVQRYGEDYVEVIQSKSKQTNLERYGVEFPLQSESIKDKTSGFTPASRQKARESLLARYGVASGNGGLDPELNATLIENVDRLHYTEKWSISAIAKHYGVTNSSVLRRLSGGVIRHCRSALEVKVVEFIKHHAPQLEIVTNDRIILSPKEIDVWIPSLRVGIELHGNWFHSFRNGTPPNAHLDKTTQASNQGVRLIHLFQSEVEGSEKWKDVILTALGLNTRIYARQLICKSIVASEAQQFLDNNHFQGAGVIPKVAYGLYNGDELVQVMTFGSPRYSNNAEWELLRMATASGITVVGGASKLFKRFIADHNPKSILSYCDRRLFGGMVYSQLGFQLDHYSRPGYWYFHTNDVSQQLYHRAHFQKHKLSVLLEDFDPDLTEWENMSINGWNKVYDCGNSVWLWVNS